LTGYDPIRVTTCRDPSLYENFLFSVHRAPILIILLPLYIIYPYPETLILSNVVLHVLAALALYNLCMHEMKSYRLSSALTALYLFNPLNWYTATYDFHLESFIPLFTILQYYYLVERRYRLATLSAIALCLSLEVGPVIAALNSICHLIQLHMKRTSILKSGAILSTLLSVTFSVVWFKYSTERPVTDGGLGGWFVLKYLAEGNMTGAIANALGRMLSYDSVV